ncbi:MAG: hypothetical protein ABSD42_04100 [Candidatus Bathyarchaeia archaeon]|jgi:hypothetical protein
MTKKHDLHIRPDDWLWQALVTYANVHKLTDESGDFNKTDATQGLIEELMEKAKSRDTALNALVIEKERNDTLQKGAQSTFCQPRGKSVLTINCYCCQVQVMKGRSSTDVFELQKPIKDCVERRMVVSPIVF